MKSKNNEIKTRGTYNGWKRFTEKVPKTDDQYLILLPSVESLMDDGSKTLLLMYRVANIEFYKNDETGEDMIAIYEKKENTGDSIYYYETTFMFYNGAISEIGETVGAPLFWMELPDIPD